ncbi:MAG: TetR/AcrR family transcriptional regulator [Micropruina sp.]|nr:TetR/AcrR family transcriptional regulator [Micropruina sp.]
MPADERRLALIAATIPLLIEHGASVSTKQIARAAGVAEGTIFRVFDSKNELISEAIIDAMTAEGVLNDLRTIDTGLPARAALAAVMKILIAEIGRTHALFSLLAHHPTVSTGRNCPAFDPHARRAQVEAALVQALTPYAHEFRVTPRVVAAVLLALALATAHPMTQDNTLAEPDAVADLVLYGLSQEH